MLFNSAIFFGFLVVVLAIYWVTPWLKVQKALLIAASAVFYAAWDWRFLGLLIFVIVTVYATHWLILVSRANGNERRARLYLQLCIGLQLLVLAFFKYFNFFQDNLFTFIRWFGFSQSEPLLRILLPIGISFYTFHAITLAVDTYRGTVSNRVGLGDVALYISFFPQLVAGPIVRATVFIPQLASRRAVNGQDIVTALQTIVAGFLYKVAFSDTIAPFVDQVFQKPGSFSGGTLFAATLGFYAQIYFDFNWYSLIAIGVSRLFGYRLPDNFNFPYAAHSLSNFWRRWHISLSSWLRDYLYIPLGGNRHGFHSQLRNLMITMLLGGLWHGASWNFVLWGALHGSALCLERLLAPGGGRHREQISSSSVPELSIVAGWLWTQTFVFVCWIPFRAHTFGDTITVLTRMIGNAGSAERISIPWAMLLIPILCDTLIVSRLRTSGPRVLLRLEVALPLLVLAGFAVCLVAKTGLRTFIYFQF
jgi:D-alanyl-lipoteichoic acid acyltransferase DltB (MBOAT superfamily)